MTDDLVSYWSDDWFLSNIDRSMDNDYDYIGRLIDNDYINWFRDNDYDHWLING